MGRRYGITVGLLLALLGPMASAQAELVMKILVVNPSETETKEFDIRNPLPPEVKPEHVLDAEGLKVDYDSQAGTYMLVGTVTLKPKESIVRRVLLEDVWVIAAERLTSVRRETQAVLTKLEGSAYVENAQLVVKSIERRLGEIEESQDQPFLNPVQHINRYRENLKTLQMVETDLVSLRQLMVMAALNPPSQPAVMPGAEAGRGAETGHEKGSLSILATWRLIFIVLGLLGFVSLSFFLIWQRQLKLQLAKQMARDTTLLEGENGHGNGTPPSRTDASLPSSTTPPLS